MPGYKERKEKLRQLVKEQELERQRKVQEEGYPYKATDAFRVSEKEYKYYKYRRTDYSKVRDIEQMKKRRVEGYDVY